MKNGKILLIGLGTKYFSLDDHKEETRTENLVFLLGFRVGKEGGDTSCYASLVANVEFVGVVSAHVCLHDWAKHRPHPCRQKCSEGFGEL